MYAVICASDYSKIKYNDTKTDCGAESNKNAETKANKKTKETSQNTKTGQDTGTCGST